MNDKTPKVKPKYKIGQKVWRMNNDKPSKATITMIATLFAITTKKEDLNQYIYSFNRNISAAAIYWYSDNNLFPTKQSLIDSL